MPRNERRVAKEGPRRHGAARGAPCRSQVAIDRLGGRYVPACAVSPLLLLATIPLAGCERIGDIFQAGVWVGGIFVVLIIGIVGFIAAKLRA